MACFYYVDCEANVLLHAVCYSISRCFVRAFFAGCVALLIVLATHRDSFANTFVSAGHDSLLSSSTLANSSCTDDDAADGVQACSSNGDSLAGKATFFNTSSSRTRPVEPVAADSSTTDSAADNRLPDWDGVWRDTGILLGSQFVAAGIIYVLPESFSSWSGEQKKNSFKKYARNVVDPVIDKDAFYINYILHPYWGATYYIRARERGLDKFPSFMYSALISAMYEFGVECFFEKPSIQDLVVTPVAGSLVGALIFEPWRESIKRKQDLRWYDHVALVATDPVGFLSLGFEKMFGIKTTIMVDYSVPQIQKRSTGSVVASKSSRIGVVMQFPFD